ncbi:hypothetical protein [Parendozoicomonas sp. Alg238-R29]|uniref:hypothetical protein n=1 Tax=Parendozoicomonas sp. Alg238-R29 TaxID=2993446 RepID=UPI00248EE236|nr:hypothetical protein [Parendozoicomonas sp. Alg238-R29]
MKLKSSLLAPGFLTLFTLMANLPVVDTPANKLYRFIQEVFGPALEISDDQVQQLSWVLENPISTPAMDIVYRTNQKTGTIHREVPRALSRLYNLQLLRSGTEKDYRAFVAPQLSGEQLFLSYESFQKISAEFKKLDEESLETLKAAAIIHAVALSPRARERADVILKNIPSDSSQFLTQTAEHAASIYPLARQVISKYPGAEEKFKAIFLPDSNLHHMLYGEGSQAMFKNFRRLACISDCEEKRKLWILHWIVHISGSQGHIVPKGSIYLDQHTYTALGELFNVMATYSNNPDAPVELKEYIAARTRSLGIETTDDNSNAIGLLAALSRVYTPDQGKNLIQGFKQLSQEDQARWIKYSDKQFSIQPVAAPTYIPALLANGFKMAGIARTVSTMLPLILNTLEEVDDLRELEMMTSDTPLSFRELASADSVKRILISGKTPNVDIDTHSGAATLKTPRRITVTRVAMKIRIRPLPQLQ